MNFSLKKLSDYCERHTSPVDQIRHELERETNLKTLAPQMLSGSYQGKLLEMISYMVRPQHILEIGTFTGYGALCLAKGLDVNGKITTIESNFELEHLIKKYITKSGEEERIELIIGDAKQIIPTLDMQYDIVYIDAGKQDYSLYFDLVFDKVKSNGIIIADNVLWSGKVVMVNMDKDTSMINEFNQKVSNDTRVEQIMLPIRDGITLIRKI